MSNLENNTTELQSILSTINELPDAGESAGAAIIDVTELPTEDIQEDVFYRLLTGTFVYNQYTQNGWTCYCVEGLPEVGEPATSDMVNITAYYNTQDGSTNVYMSTDLSATTGMDVGWYPIETVLLSVGYNWGGVIYDIMDDPMDGAIRLILNYELFSHKDAWSSNKTIGWIGSGISAEIFNRRSNVASGLCSHAEGSNTTASGDYSHAEGSGTIASGSSSHAEGSGTIASGRSSHAEGSYTTASGDHSHAEGYKTIASGKFSHVEGLFNIEDLNTKYAHIVGNGKLGEPSNAHTLDWEGNAWFAGSVEGTALILTSPNGTRFQITVSDDGVLNAAAITE